MHTDSANDLFSDSRVGEICERLKEDRRVRRSLPVWGRLHIDRQLPFLCVYRRPSDRKDPGTDRLVLGEAAYLTAPGSRRLHQRLSSLVRNIAETLAGSFGAFLIIELWSEREDSEVRLAGRGGRKPAFRILVPKNSAISTGIIERFEKHLKRVKVLKLPSDVEVVHGRKVSPPGMTQLLSQDDAAGLGIHLIGLEIKTIYRDSKTGQIFPVVLRTLQRRLARAFKQIFFEFARSETSHFPAHYHALGRRAMVKAVWDVDYLLAEVGNAFDFLLYLTPTNPEAAWREFKRSGYERAPEFFYRPLPVDPVSLKRRLYQVPTEKVEDPIIAQIFQEKQEELDRRITLLADRGSKRFLYGSLQVFGGVDDTTLKIGQEILERLPPRSRDDSAGGSLDAEAFALRARAEIEYYKEVNPGFSAGVEVRTDISGLLVSRDKLLVGRESKIPALRVEALLQHEIGTHLVTYFNGRAQPFRQLYSGLAGYEKLQEGLAVLSEYLVGGLSRPRLRLLAARVIAVRRLCEGASFVETFRELDRNHEFDRRTAFTITMRVYRSGGLTKDAVYLEGLVELLRYLKKGGELEPLFVGKINPTHVPIVKELQWRQVLRPISFRPRYMGRPETAQRLTRLRGGDRSPLDLIERRPVEHENRSCRQ